MAGSKISNLPQISTGGVGGPALTDIIAEVQPPLNGVTYQSTLNQILTLFESVISIFPANGGTGVPSPTAHTIPIAEGSSNFNFLGPLTNGQLLIGSTAADPVAAAISAGVGITTSVGAGSITIGVSGGGLGWTEVTTTSQSMAFNNGYIVNNAGLVTLTLPVLSPVGSVISLIGKGAGGWSIAQNAGQIIHVGASPSTIGVGGSVSSANQYDSIRLVCTVANTAWTTEGTPKSAGLIIV